MGIEEKINRRHKVNINSLSQNLFNKINKPNSIKKPEAALKFDSENKLMGASTDNKDDLLSQFWSMTDKMPKEDQVSLAASVIASKVFSNGITSENKAFIKNIGNKFSPNEIGDLKNEIKSHPLIKDKSAAQVDNFIKDFEQFLAKPTSEIGALQNGRPISTPRSPEEIFFQTTMKFSNSNKSVFAV